MIAHCPADDLAALSGVSSIQKIEIGPVVEPGYFTIVALCQALEVNLADVNGASLK